MVILDSATPLKDGYFLQKTQCNHVFEATFAKLFFVAKSVVVTLGYPGGCTVVSPCFIYILYIYSV